MKIDLEFYSVMFAEGVDIVMIVESVLIGYDRNFNLLFELRHTDYNEPEYSSSIFMCMEEEEALLLAQRLDTSLHELPKIIGRRFYRKYSTYVNPCYYDVHTCFSEMLDFLLDYGCHYRIVEQPGKDDYIFRPKRPERETLREPNSDWDDENEWCYY